MERSNPKTVAELAQRLREAADCATGVHTPTTPPAVPDHAYMDARRLDFIGRKVNAIAIDECNRPLTPYEEQLRATLTSEARVICKGWNSTLQSDGDPRGYVLKVKLPTGRYNNMGGEAWGLG